MTVTKRIMAPGAFNLRLNPRTPFTISDTFEPGAKGFGHIIITPAWIDPSLVSFSELLDLSCFTGLYFTRTDRLELRGNHVSAWLGWGNGLSVIIPPGGNISANVNLATWIGYFNNHLFPGTFGAFGTLNWTTTTPRALENIQFICDYFGAEWQVTDDLTLNANTVTALYGGPTTIATPWWDGRDNELTGIRSTLTHDRSLEDYSTNIYISGAGGGNAFDVSPSPEYFDGTTIGLRPTRALSGADATVAGTGATLAANLLAFYERPTDKITLTTDTFCPMADVVCGAPMWVWSPDRDLYDPTFANEIHYGGHITWPLSCRVRAIDMPVRRGMGVVYADGIDQTMTDLTPYIEWESGQGRIELGDPHETLSAAVKRRGLLA